MHAELERGRRRYGKREWRGAYEALSLADRLVALGGGDLELLAMSAYLIGRDDEYLRALERAYRAFLDMGEDVRAARCAFWLGLRLLFRGETGSATGWLGRAQRLLERQQDCVEQGYLLLPRVQQHLDSRDCELAYTRAADAVRIGERFGDADLVACARHLQGRALLSQGSLAQGLALLDEAMVAVTAGELSPLVTGLIYCSVIDGCQQVYALSRAREWTFALERWCGQQPDLVAFTGVCRTHRAQIMQLHGAWAAALEEARRACERCHGVNERAAGAAYYQQAEVHRLQGAFAAAEEAYRCASQRGWEPQPGLALLRMTQGRTEAAEAASRRALVATAEPLERAKLLPAHVEIMLAAGDLPQARAACSELEAIARQFDAEVPGALAAHARGALGLAEGNAEAALASLRHAWQVWQHVEAPYQAARARVLIGLACRALGDDDGSRLELEAARAAFAQLGAAPDIAQVDALAQGPAARVHGLTARELQVLRLVAAGDTNKAIAARLSLSERTIDRHVSNIFTKLTVSSRAAATAFAYAHKLV